MRLHLLATLLFIIFLAPAYSQHNVDHYLTEDGDLHLLGSFERDKLELDPFQTWYNRVYEGYTLDEETIAKLNRFYDEDIDIKIYLGTWCGDSKREVTRFLKLVDHSDLSMDQVELIGLDSRPENLKQGPNREEKGLGIHRVPTFLFYKDGEEIGRIVERPVSTLETDIAQIYAGLASRPNYRLANYMLDQLATESLTTVDTLISQNARYLRRYSKNEGELNTLGYVLMAADQYEQAILVFKLNTLLYPESGNTFDSLGEAYLNSGNRELATANYLKSLQLDPANENAADILQGMLVSDEGD